MKLWIVGARGLLGSALAEAAGESSLCTGSEVDIGDLNALRSFVQKNPSITHIANCAALSVVDFCETHQTDAFRVNALGPENLGRVAQEIGAKLVHISTDYVFSGSTARPLKETDLVSPVNYYGETKLEGEKRLQKVLPSACIIRTSWLFGRGGKNFVAKLLTMFSDKEEIKLAHDQWGRPTYAPDLAAAILQMFDSPGIYQFANRGEATKFSFGCAMRDLAEEMKFSLRTKSVVAVPSSFFPAPAQRPPYSVFDTSKIEKILKSPIRPWQEALKEFLRDKIS